MGDKSQAVRLLDVFVFGPFMIWAGVRASTLPDVARGGLVVLGLGTMGYNLRNYRNAKLLAEGG